ncbi:energy-coupling factor transporter ATPase [Tengunoibacter tsumagoiensis]|uniref:Energy-coupling factor transporter ATP-binding protein EcfA n=1 Tax=Tengunoibacter tsumagoiensis TaxID=2014871 RepID=A0A402A1X1_9CHLR|nr:energy-coupling factor transporter ATPase [Tengunoibacter tsumagoiensis]GCE12991.1 energy-coupling factor transporter ATP-binding protein EcfA [Tengunoibacter tsumagoiensis]
MSETIIRTQNLGYAYTSGPSPRHVLTDVSLEIERGSCVAIIGTNGSGKTTLVQHFNGLLRPTSGTVWVDGVNLGTKQSTVRELRRRVGLLFQFPESQLFERTIYDDVAFGPRRLRLSESEVQQRVYRALMAVHLPLPEYAQRSPFALSGGQRRRVALAVLLAMEPTILILDEPSVGLDGEARQELYQILQEIRLEREVTIVLVSHDMAEVASICDRLYLLHEGRLVLQGPPRTIFAQSQQVLQYGLALPPLNELLHLLRQQGMSIPEELFTLEEVYAFFVNQRRQAHQ